METFSLLAYGFQIALTPENLFYAFIGAFFGTVVGVLPGLGPSAAIALLLPITFHVESSVGAIIMLAGIFYGAQYGGSTTSILINIPGEAASVVTCFDGYKMAQQGHAAAALGVSAVGSFFAGSFAIIALTLIAPPLGEVALQFGPQEYFSLALFGLLLTPYLSGGSPIKGLLMVLLGLLFGMIGLDPILGLPRFSEGLFELQDGLVFSPVAVGLFGLGEILYNIEKKDIEPQIIGRFKKFFLPAREIFEGRWAIVRGSVIGFFIGLIPGGGATIASMISYVIEKRISKWPEKFGNGAIEGVASPESANNSAATASFIPLLTLGLPGNAAIAMIFTGLMIQGVQPGPLLMIDHADMFWGVIASMYIGNVMLLVLNLPLVGFWVQLLRVPQTIVTPVIIAVSVIGSYSVRNSVFDVGIMVGFGALGYFLRKLKFEYGPLVLAFVLGNILEVSLRQSLLISQGNFFTFINRPISGSLIGFLVILVTAKLFWPKIRGYFSKNDY